MKYSRQTEVGIQLAPLDQVIEKHFPNLQGREPAAFEQSRLAFSQSLVMLAADYAKRRKDANDADAGRQRFAAIAAAAEKLRATLGMLSAAELNAITDKQREAFRTHFHELNEEEADDLAELHDSSEEPLGPRLATCMLEYRDLYWLEQGAKRLSQPRKRGRQINPAVRWAVEEFVVLCHRHGWSPIGVSHSYADKLNANPQASDAVICLAAIFVAGGKHEIRAMISALSALRSMRKAITRVEWPDESNDYSEPDYYSVCLETMTMDWPSWLPKFGKKADLRSANCGQK